MAITIDWPIGIINIPRNDLTLIQSFPTEIRELNLNDFRLELKDLEDGEHEGITWLKTHIHNTEVSLGGVTYARVIEIIDPYTITFENGLYAVNLVGANSNVGDKVNVNQVSVRSANSAGLTVPIDVKSIVDGVWDEPMGEHDISETMGRSMIHNEYGDRIYVSENGVSGTTYLIGTLETPSNNLTDAKIIANNYNINKFHITGTFNIFSGEDISDFTFISERSLGNNIIVNDGVITNETYFNDLTVSGTMNGSVRYTRCVLGVINNFDGGAKNSLITNTITIVGTDSNYLTDCDVFIIDPTQPKEINVGSATLNLIRCRGGFRITNKTSTNTLAIDMVAGIIYVDDTCNEGQIFIGGITEVVDNSHVNCEVFIKSMSHEAISQNVWDEPLTAAIHNKPTSAGKKLRSLSSSVVRNELAQGSGINGNQIVFDDDASDVDGSYDPGIVFIIEGTGAGQARLILQYHGASRTATVDRNWKVEPDDTSEFVIIADAGREHVNEGLAQSGTTTTITLNLNASSTNNIYNGQVIFIRSGTGQDQSRRVISYNGATKTATIGSDWLVIPDSSSGYVMLPTGTISHKMIADAVWDGLVSSYGDVGTFGKAISDILISGGSLTVIQATQLEELYKLQGLELGNPMTVTQNSRKVDTIDLAITGDGKTITTVTRQ